MSGNNDERNITQTEMDAQIAMTKVNSRLEQLESLQEKQFNKIDNLVDEMKKVVHEVTTAHREHIDSSYVSKDTYYQREEQQKTVIEDHLNAVSKRFEVALGKQHDQIMQLRLRMTQVSTALIVAWAAIQFAIKYIP